MGDMSWSPVCRALLPLAKGRVNEPAAWGPNPGHRADLDGDGAVGITGFLTLLGACGPCI